MIVSHPSILEINLLPMSNTTQRKVLGPGEISRTCLKKVMNIVIFVSEEHHMVLLTINDEIYTR